MTAASRQTPRICIVGAGAVGSHLAARLIHGGLQVSVVARGDNLQALRARGLQFESPTQRFQVAVPATDDAASLGPQDLVITATKAQALPTLVDTLRPLLGPETVVVFAVNGIPWWYAPAPDAQRGLPRLDPQGHLHGVVGPGRALGCVVSSPNQLVEPGVVQCRLAENRFELGEPGGGLSERLSHWAQVLGQALPDIVAVPDLRTSIWNKLLLNVPSSLLSTLTDSEPWRFAAHADVQALYGALIEETAQVAAAQGSHIDVNLPARLGMLGKVRHVPSMLHDLRSGRSLEIDAQLLAVQDLARLSQVATPMLDTLLTVLQQRLRAASPAGLH